MLAYARRPHLRIEDRIYYDYCLQPSPIAKTEPYQEEWLTQRDTKYLETTRYFHGLDLELEEIAYPLSIHEPTLVQYLTVLNAKIDHLAQQLLMSENIHLRTVYLSLDGMCFKTEKRIKEKTPVKLVIYTKPKLLPILVHAEVIYSQFHTMNHYRTLVGFGNLNEEQEQLLSQHILFARAKQMTSEIK